MGSGQSARKLTISNEEEIGVIKVSDAIVQRLTQSSDQINNERIKDVRSTPPMHHNTTTNTNTVTTPPPHGGDVPPGYPVYYHPEFTLSALQMQQQKEQELQKQDKYWQERIKNLEESHQKINSIMQKEYKKAIAELTSDKKGRSLIAENTVQPCMENSEKVLKCYQEHPKETLKCSSLVEEFSTCVDQRRSRVIAARC